mmetsp:Transcript_12622/g.26060  ORF Transcript_12622/g.26060 Transcript_12622/m.26060 type:complete len:205 (+) Transcript_12622:909-1523(+)
MSTCSLDRLRRVLGLFERLLDRRLFFGAKGSDRFSSFTILGLARICFARTATSGPVYPTGIATRISPKVILAELTPVLVRDSDARSSWLTISSSVFGRQRPVYVWVPRAGSVALSGIIAMISPTVVSVGEYMSWINSKVLSFGCKSRRKILYELGSDFLRPLLLSNLLLLELLRALLEGNLSSEVLLRGIFPSLFSEAETFSFS